MVLISKLFGALTKFVPMLTQTYLNRLGIAKHIKNKTTTVGF